MPDFFNEVTALVTRLQAEQKANMQLAQTDIKSNMQDMQGHIDEQLKQEGIAARRKEIDATAIAEGVNQLETNLQANPLDPTSLMARNNVAITALNERILNQYNAISNIQQDDSIVGILGQELLMPHLLVGQDQLTQMRTNFINQNTTLHNNLANQSQQITSDVLRADNELTLAQQRADAAKAMAAVADNKLKTATDYFKIQHTVSQDAIQTATTLAELQAKAITLPLDIAIKKNQVLQIEQQQDLDAMVTNFMGWPAGSSRQNLMQLKLNPQAYNAAVSVIASGTMHTPFDAELILPYMNVRALTNADGSTKPQLALAQDLARPVLADRINNLHVGLRDSMTKEQMTPEQMNKVFSNRALLSNALNNYVKKHPEKNIQSDVAFWNPAQVFKAIPNLEQQVPLIKDVVNTTENKRTDIAPVDLANIVVRGNMNVPTVQIASQLATYYQNALVFDQQRDIYSVAGIAPPTVATASVSRPSFMNKMNRMFLQSRLTGVKDVQTSAEITEAMKTNVLSGNTAKSSLNLTNQADWIDYIDEIKYRANVETAQ